MQQLIDQSPSTGPSVLDPAQLSRIEATHRGFLYQHLFAVACLLQLAGLADGDVVVEADEDIEVSFGDTRFYLQIKTRSNGLQRSDVIEIRQRFFAVRAKHQSGERSGLALFAIVTDTAPSMALRSDIEAADWPNDVSVIWPGSATVPDNRLPPAWPNLDSALSWCIERADRIPLRTVQAETLVWKLAAKVQFAATGQDTIRPNHRFARAELPLLFEQLVEGLHEFPAPPTDYRPQVGEPPLQSEQHVRIIAGLSGAGKTAWAGAAAQHTPAPMAYFDVGDLPSPAVAKSLARELAARFLGENAARLPADSGLEMLRALDQRVQTVPRPIVVLDNIHRLEPDDLRAIVEACPRTRFVCLGQPCPQLSQAANRIGLEIELLQGWDTEVIASVFSAAGSGLDMAQAERWKRLTGGLPLFVKNAALLAGKLHGANAEQFATEIEQNTHSIETAQDAILARVIDGLSGAARRTLAVVALSKVALTATELRKIMAAASLPQDGTALRELSACGLLQLYQDGTLKLHDAIIVAATHLQAELPVEAVSQARLALRDLLKASLPDLMRFSAWLRLLAPTGAVSTLIDLATEEVFHEVGDPRDLKSVLEAAAADPALDDQTRFWALDALLFWDWQYGQKGTDPLGRLLHMDHLLRAGNLGPREGASLTMKRMLREAEHGNAAEVEAFYRQALPFCTGSKLLTRILRYNHASALYKLGQLRQGETEAQRLFEEYYDDLGLTVADVAAANPPKIAARLRYPVEDCADDLKRLADCLNLFAMARRSQGLHSGLAQLHAMKFFQMSTSYRSAVKAGMDAADDFVSPQYDPEGARMIMEGHVLPVIRQFGLTESELEARALYAVILAYCGDAHAATEEMRRLKAFAAGLLPEHRGGLAKQAELVERINAGKIVLPPRTPAIKPSLPAHKIGRNVPCPCGSGRKFKRCHGG